MVIIANANTAIVWLLHAKYLQRMLKPSVLIFANTRIPATNAKITAERVNLFAGDFWSMLRKSASISLSALRAVSPEVIGRTITPMMATTPPMFPRRSLATIPITAGEPIRSASIPLLYIPIAAAAHIIAMNPSRSIMLKNVVLPSLSLDTDLAISVD